MRRSGNRLLVARGESEKIKVSSDSSAAEVRCRAVEQFSLFNELFRRDLEYDLLFRDGRSADYIPGSGEPFTVEKYKQRKGISYSKIKLYLCPKRDIASGWYYY